MVGARDRNQRPWRMRGAARVQIARVPDQRGNLAVPYAMVSGLLTGGKRSGESLISASVIFSFRSNR